MMNQDPIACNRKGLRAETTAIRAELAALELRLIKWIVGTGIAVGAGVIAALRLLLG